MDPTIAALLAQDGITNGAIYALLALALVLVFTVTRIVWIPAGEFVAWGTLTSPDCRPAPCRTLKVLVGMAVIAGLMEAWSCVQRGQARRVPGRLRCGSARPH
jgi:branched-chain amino acid transport system permease protein